MEESLVLVVDDEEGIRESLSDILKDEGHEVITSETGEEALKIIRENNPDLIFLDIWLPGMDGLQALKEIKEVNPELTVVMISGHGTIDLAVKATKMGAYEFLEKPLSIDRVLLVTKKCTRKKEN